MLVKVIEFNAALFLESLASGPGFTVTDCKMPAMDLEPAPRDEQPVSDACTFEREDDGDPG